MAIKSLDTCFTKTSCNDDIRNDGVISFRDEILLVCLKRYTIIGFSLTHHDLKINSAVNGDGDFC